MDGCYTLSRFTLRIQNALVDFISQCAVSIKVMLLFLFVDFSLEGRLCELEEEVGEANDSLRMQLSSDHGGYESKIISTEKELKKLKGSLDQIQIQSDGLMSFGKKVGTRLIDIRKRQEKALNVADILDHVNIFAQCRDLSTLPACFHDDGELEKSAVRAYKVGFCCA